MLLAGLSAGLVTRRAPKAQVICTAAPYGPLGGGRGFMCGIAGRTAF